MAYLKLWLSECSSSFGVGGYRDGWQARWNAKMDWLESVKLSTGKNLADMRGIFSIRAFDGDRGEEPLGFLHHIEPYPGSEDGVVKASPEHYSVEVLLPEKDLVELLRLERQGHGATNVSVDVPELQYGVLPDGSDKKWALAEDANQSLPVTGITFWFPTQPSEVVDDDDEHKPDPLSKVSAEVEAIDRLRGDLSKLVPWIIGMMIVIAIASVLRR